VVGGDERALGNQRVDGAERPRRGGELGHVGMIAVVVDAC
jgi:hypothetical protein